MPLQTEQGQESRSYLSQQMELAMTVFRSSLPTSLKFIESEQ